MATSRIYVGNIPFSTTEQELRSAFSACGQVHKVDVVLDRETGRPRGFAFVEMDSADVGGAIEQMDGADLGGRRLTVNHAKERARSSRPQRERRDWT